MLQDIVVGFLLFLLLAASLEAGFRLGRRAAGKKDQPTGGQVGAIQGGMLGLLGLLLAFSFGGATSRFMDRQDLILQEANAIGTAYLRTDMLDEPHRSELRTALRQYVSHRVKVSENLRHGLAPEALSEISRSHDQIWKAAREGVLAKPGSMVAVLNPINEVIDLHTSRIVAGKKHLPIPVLVLLILCSAMSMVVIGFGAGQAGRRTWLMTGSLAVLLAASIWVTFDLDHPRAGLIQLNDWPLRELEASLSR